MRVLDSVFVIMKLGSIHENPRRTGIRIVAIATHDGGLPVSRERYGMALGRRPRRARAHELGSILCPHASISLPDPRGSGAGAVVGSSDEGRVAVGGEGHGKALLSGSTCVRGDQLALLYPARSVERPDPRGSHL